MSRKGLKLVRQVKRGFARKVMPIFFRSNQVTNNQLTLWVISHQPRRVGGHLVDFDEPCLGSINRKTINHNATAIKKSALAICAFVVICKKNSLFILFYIFLKFYCEPRK